MRRMGVRVLAAALLGACLATGCAAAPPQGSANPCEFGAVAFDVGPVALCQQAVAIAEARLGWLHWPVTSIRFLSSMCPPNARCAFVLGPGNEGWVVFTFSIGDPSMIHVAMDATGALIVGNPEPPPDWLLGELRGQAPSRPAAPQPVGG